MAVFARRPKNNGRNNEVVVRRGFTVMIITSKVESSTVLVANSAKGDVFIVEFN